MAFALLIVVAWIIIQPEKSPNTDDLIGNAHTSDGKKLNESEQMIIHFWSLDCLPCKRDAQILQRFHRKHSDYQIVGINVDGSEKNSEISSWINSLKVDYEMAVSTGDSLPSTIPSTFITLKGNTQGYKTINKPLTYRTLLDATEKDR